MVTSWYDTQQCKSGLHKSDPKAQQGSSGIIWTAAKPPDREAEAIRRGYALHCPQTGEFAWKGECDE